MTTVDLDFRVGMTLRASSGLEELGNMDRASTPFFYYAQAGDRLRLLDERFLFNVATYAPTVDEKYIYTYDYQPNESWTSYNCDLSGETYRTLDYVFDEPVYFRVCIKQTDDKSFSEKDKLRGIVEFQSRGVEYKNKPWLEEEALRVAKRVNERKNRNTLSFALLSDSHFVVNGTWDDTAYSIKWVHELVGFDGIIHLGDLTDGMVTREVTERYVRRIIGDLCANDIPVYMAIGNHDSNYFRKNPEPLSLKEQCELYLTHSDGYTVREPGNPCYYTDLNGLRLISIHSFDPHEERRYGFSMEHIKWLERTLETTPDGYKVLVISHLTPLTKLQTWVDEIRNGDALYRVLEQYNSKRGGILAYINGHIHADHVYTEGSFPLISICNAKTEEFYQHKLVDSATPARKLGDASQEAWNVLLVEPDTARLELVRFGAGEDICV